jgi:hypothetical protein
MKTLLAVILLAGTLQADPWLEKNLDEVNAHAQADRDRRYQDSYNDTVRANDSMRANQNSQDTITALNGIATAVNNNNLNGSRVVLPSR